MLRLRRGWGWGGERARPQRGQLSGPPVSEGWTARASGQVCPQRAVPLWELLGSRLEALLLPRHMPCTTSTRGSPVPQALLAHWESWAAVAIPTPRQSSRSAFASSQAPVGTLVCLTYPLTPCENPNCKDS